MPNSPMAAAVLKLADDPSWTVRRQLAASIGELPPAARLEPAAMLLTKYGSDPILVDVTISGLKGSEADVLNRVLQPNVASGEADAVGDARGGDCQERRRHRSAGDRGARGRSAAPAWQRTAVLQGLDTGLPAAGRGPRRAAVAEVGRPRRGAGQAGRPRRRAGGAGRAWRMRPTSRVRWPSASSRNSIGRASRCRS